MIFIYLQATLLDTNLPILVRIQVSINLCAMNENLESKIDTLRSNPNFEHNTREELISLASSAKWFTFENNDVIFHQGDIPKYAHIVCSGRVKVYRISITGKVFNIMISAPFNTLNAVACFGPKPRFFSAKAMEDVRLLAIPAGTFVNFVIKHPINAKSVISIMGDHQMSAINRVMDLLEEGVQQRILNVLMLLNNRFGPDLPLKNIDIARLAGTTRETTARIIRNLDASGLLDKSWGQIKILDPELLKEIASDRFFII